MPTRLTFDNDHSIVVEEDLNAVEGALRAAPPGVAGLVQFTCKGEKVFVNAALVRSIAERKTRSGAAFS
jgi:hypothetical protein